MDDSHANVQAYVRWPRPQQIDRKTLHAPRNEVDDVFQDGNFYCELKAAARSIIVGVVTGR